MASDPFVEIEGASFTFVTLTVTVSYPALEALSRALNTTMYVLFVSASVGISKFGAAEKAKVAAVSVDRVRMNFAWSTPPKMLIVAFSSVEIVPTEVRFSATLKLSADGNVGGVESSAPCTKNESPVIDP